MRGVFGVEREARNGKNVPLHALVIPTVSDDLGRMPFKLFSRVSNFQPVRFLRNEFVKAIFDLNRVIKAICRYRKRFSIG